MQRAQRPHPAAPTIIGIFQTETVLDRIDKAATPGDGLEREAGEDAAAASEAGGVQKQGRNSIQSRILARKVSPKVFQNI